ncbi:MAG TPA: hypothetical protein VGY56_10500 [Verrucomicrobiae bacterium]|nr:hypothetical protein [Verrucomicrobiae bacterium]
MTIVAFMQNMWVREPARIERQLASVPPRHREKLRSALIRYCLFAGCLTGRRLRKAFGEYLCQQIIWDEASPKICDTPREIPPAEIPHILAVLRRHDPKIVIAFGKSAGDALRSCWTGPIVFSPHPACRRQEDLVKLQQAAYMTKFLFKSIGEL